MGGRIRLGKSKDSRTRKKAVSTAETERLKEVLKNQQGFAGYLLRKGYSTSTTNRYVNDIGMFTAWAVQENVPVENVGYTDVLHYIQGKRNTVKQRTISCHINSIKHYFNFLAVTDQTIENPTAQIKIRGIKRKALYHTLSKQGMESLYHNFEIPDENVPYKNQNWYKASVLASKRNKMILGLMVYQGLGSTALGRLTKKDVKLREGKIFIAGTRRSNERELKLGAHQILDMMEYILHIRQKLLELNNKKSGRLFTSTGTSDKFRSIINRLMKKLNKQDCKVTSVQQIRTSVIIHWLKTFNLRQVQYMAGHRYVGSTEAYLANDVDSLQEEISKFHPLG